MTFEHMKVCLTSEIAATTAMVLIAKATGRHRDAKVLEEQAEAMKMCLRFAEEGRRYCKDVAKDLTNKYLDKGE